MHNPRVNRVLTFVLMFLITSGAAASQKLNVLFIAMDDLNNDLGCYGVRQVQSPNIDRLAGGGVRFERAYCQFPLCSPSRSSLMTGLRPDAIRVFDLQYHFRSEVPDVVTLSQLFKTNGYYAARVGKIYHYGNPGQIGTSGLDDPPSWTEVFNPAGRDRTEIQKDIINFTPQRGLGSAMALLQDITGKAEEHTDGLVATETIRLLREHKDKPFFLAAGFYKPHTPYVAPSKYFQLYPAKEIALPTTPADLLKTVPSPALASTRPWPWFGVTEEEARECKRAYYATISMTDAQIGRVLDELDRLKLTDKTVIVFWSDHGYHLGEHGLWMKQSCFEESARVPLVIAAPGFNSGKVCKRTVELLDLYPTLTELAGLVAPEGIQGATLVPLLRNPESRRDRAAFTQVQRANFPGHSVRTERWRYTEWDGGKEGVELYDHEKDPHELNNLALDAGQKRTVDEMKALVRKNWPRRVQGGKVRPAVN
jgi:iduronate 2-sulfatase